ncbi:MAG: hypothetical protein A3J62_02930 [Candidatus Buchananbacteria bacterium RIFCSPHIGHO2_02_FULL_38_8]|uniref:Uncharacterized protein n=2 Tax=Candidatus Buchananiibacteriota TaxID=1817903 RepID=A0A1G1XW91_9BACT|nr:MAG: hypothetical protein A2731_03310 [Candidatus Buchananbacteria bacterium RIFCSPHIGHO2_01_FULL_39_8]OGY47935.1 MAG: hypothetical protein A3J62_02930 [Candidatus Buchananbacteria bacterium RIFCSPHIGHO2_02_FULL_38_8]
MDKAPKQFTGSIIFLIIIGVIIFVSYFLDKELSKILGIAGFFAWFLREYFKNLINKDLERFKHDLLVESTRFKVQYEKLHSDRAEVVKIIYQKIARVSGKIRRSVHNLRYEDRKEKNPKINEIADEFYDLVYYYEENALFFEEEIQKLFNPLLQLMFQMLTLFTFLSNDPQMVKLVDSGEIKEDEMTKEEFESSSNGLREEMDKSVNLLKQKLEEKFKNIIGFKIIEK